MKLTILAGLTVLLPVAALAADDIRPLDAKVGLWESSVTTEMGGRAMPAMPQIPPETLAKLPPKQREQMEAMMKARAGGAPITTKVCLTRESLSSGALGRRDNSSCTTKVVNSSSSKQVVHMDCAQGEVKSTGEMTVELVDAEHIKGTMLMKSSVGGQDRDMKMSFSNKWLSADCGDVKPAVAK